MAPASCPCGKTSPPAGSERTSSPAGLTGRLLAGRRRTCRHSPRLLLATWNLANLGLQRRAGRRDRRGHPLPRRLPPHHPAWDPPALRRLDRPPYLATLTAGTL